MALSGSGSREVEADVDCIPVRNEALEWIVVASMGAKMGSTHGGGDVVRRSSGMELVGSPTHGGGEVVRRSGGMEMVDSPTNGGGEVV